VIDWIVSEASTVKILETNIYAAASEGANDLTANKRLTAPFDFLLREIKPALVLAHGNEAKAHLRTRKTNARIIELRHFSRGWSELDAREIGRRIARECI